MPVAPWIALGGTSRRYHNPLTGETLSREKYERTYGSLAKRGAKSFKEAAKRTAPELRETRPSKSLAYSRRSRQGARTFSGMEPLAGRQTRSVTIPFHGFWIGNVAQFVSDVEPYRTYYDDAVRRIQANKRIRAMQVFAEFQNLRTLAHGRFPVNTAEAVQENVVDTFDEIVSKIMERLQNSPSAEILSLEITVSFFREYLKPALKRRSVNLKPKGKRKS